MHVTPYEQRVYVAGALHGLFLVWHQLSILRPALGDDPSKDASTHQHLSMLRSFLAALDQAPDPPEAAKARAAFRAMVNATARDIQASIDDRQADANAAHSDFVSALDAFTTELDRLATVR
jgi:hypothetical protein